MVPVASWVSVWSIRIPISAPGVIEPDSRCDSMSFLAMSRFMGDPFSGHAIGASAQPHNRSAIHGRTPDGPYGGNPCRAAPLRRARAEAFRGEDISVQNY